MHCLAPRLIFEFLPGLWQLERRIIPEVSYQPYKAHGTASIEPSSDNAFSLNYCENVISTIFTSEGTQTGLKNYLYIFNPQTDSISKCFDDGRLFYKLNQLGETICGDHLCINDTYNANYVFSDSSFTITYNVRGPSKDYTMTTIYKRIVATE